MSEDLPPTHALASPAPCLTRDLPCLSCGYNLRGLSGEPIRCPECGTVNPVGRVEPPARLLEAARHRLESLAQYEFWWALFSAASAAGLFFDAPGAVPSKIFCALVGLTPGATLFVITHRNLTRSAPHDPRWLPTLFRHHAWMLQRVLVLACLIALPLAGGFLARSSGVDGEMAVGGGLFIFCVALGFAIPLQRRLNARCRRLIRPLIEAQARKTAYEQARWTRAE